MRKLIAIILSIIFVMALCVGCDSSRATYGDYPVSYFKSIHYLTINGVGRITLWADTNTNITYFFDGWRGSPYLAPNGMPYRYDENSNTLIPIPAWEGQEIPDEWVIFIGREVIK